MRMQELWTRSFTHCPRYIEQPSPSQSKLVGAHPAMHNTKATPPPSFPVNTLLIGMHSHPYIHKAKDNHAFLNGHATKGIHSHSCTCYKAFHPILRGTDTLNSKASPTPTYRSPAVRYIASRVAGVSEVAGSTSKVSKTWRGGIYTIFCRMA